MKVFQAYYRYTETFCSPYESEWEEKEEVLITTLDEAKANTAAAEHNEKSNASYWSKKYATVRSFELT